MTLIHHILINLLLLKPLDDIVYQLHTAGIQHEVSWNTIYNIAPILYNIMYNICGAGIKTTDERFHVKVTML